MQSSQRVHFLGISGTLTGSFALFLKRQGFEVTGSEAGAIYPPMSVLLAEAGIPLFLGYAAQNLEALPAPPDWVLVGNVIRRDNPEMQAVLGKKWPYLSLPAAMEKWILAEPQNHNIVVAGTHGKTTTTSWLAFVLQQGGRDPGYFVGGVPLDLGVSFHVPVTVPTTKQPRYFILEGDEYDTAFWDKVPKFFHYLPRDIVLTSIEYDHADIYPNLESVQQAFEGLMKRLPTGGRLVVCWNDPVVRQTVERVFPTLEMAPISCVKYGRRIHPGDSEELDFYLDHFRVEGEYTLFEVYAKGGKWQDTLKIRLSGIHSALNALAVWIEARALGLEPIQLKESLAAFRGVKRRQELRGNIGGVWVMDDFAHHPTAVRETLSGLQMRYPERRLVAVFEPRSASSRRRVFQQAYVQAFLNHAHEVWVAPPYDLGHLPESDHFSSEQLVEDLQSLRQPASLLNLEDAGIKNFAGRLQGGDLVVVLSNGGFQNFIPRLMTALAARQDLVSEGG